VTTTRYVAIRGATRVKNCQ